MKRVIEKRNLAFNHMICICDLCKRWNGDFTKDDRRVCKYNKDNKGLDCGLVKNHLNNYKCKYYKRNEKYYTCKLQWKRYSKYDGTTKSEIKVKYDRGKFKVSR